MIYHRLNTWILPIIATYHVSLHDQLSIVEQSRRKYCKRKGKKPIKLNIGLVNTLPFKSV